MQKLKRTLLVSLALLALWSPARADADDCADSAYGRVLLYTGPNFTGESVNVCLTQQINKSADVELGAYFFDGPRGRQSIVGNIRSWKAEAKLPYFYAITFAGQQYYSGQGRKFYSCTSRLWNTPASRQSEADGCTQVASILHLNPSKL